MSQNVLTVDDKPQQVAGRATLMKSDAQRAVIDLGPVYANQLASVRRGVWLQPGGSVTLRDEVTAADSPATARFAFLTRADVQLNEDGATLKLDGKSLTLTVSGVPGLHMETFSTVGPQPYDAPNPGTRMVGFKVPLSPGDQAWWEVRFVPQGKSASSSLGALANW
jgi:hypothetical protein